MGSRPLDLSGCNITNQAIAKLAVLTKLEYLKLDDTKITDAGLGFAKDLPSLVYIYIRGTTVSQEAQARLKKVKPGIEILSP